MALNTLTAIAIGFILLITGVLLADYIGVSIYNAISPQLANINDTQVQSAVTSTTHGVFKGLEIFGSMISIVVIALMSMVIIGLIIKAFGGGRGGGAI